MLRRSYLIALSATGTRKDEDDEKQENYRDNEKRLEGSMPKSSQWSLQGGVIVYGLSFFLLLCTALYLPIFLQ